MNPITVGRNIARYRKTKNLTQAMLADLLGVSNKAVSKWECGRGLPDKSMFPLIQETLAITFEELTAEEPAELPDAAPVVRMKPKRRRLIAILCAGAAALCLAVVLPLTLSGDPASVPATFALSLRGASFSDGSTAISLAESASLPDILLDEEKHFIGWADADNRFYTTEGFAMPAADLTLSAVYEEDLGNPFTPSCLIEDLSTGARHTMTHENIGNIRATRYDFPDGVSANYGFKIMNGHTLRPDACNNTCPIYGDRGNIVFLTLINRGAEEVSLRYEIEYFGTLGQKTVTLSAGETVRLPVDYTTTQSGIDAITSFHQLIFLKEASSGVSVTVYGQMYNPDYYDQVKEYEVTFVGATYNGMTRFGLLYNARLSQDAVLTPTEPDKTFVGWKTSRNNVFITDEDLLRDFKMAYGDVEIIAVYREDMSLFTPSCIYGEKDKRDEVKLQGAHGDNGETTYLLDPSVAEWLIYNGTDEKHAVENGCPVSINEEFLYRMTLTNAGETDLALEIGPEYYGLRDPVTVTVPAHSTVGISLRVYGFDTQSAFWQINNLMPSQDGGDEIRLTIIGSYA